MKHNSRGFGLIELMIALTLGMILVLGVSQIFLAARSTYASQTAAANMQEDARFVLSKMMQEIRMVGMFGCVGSVTDSSTSSDFAAAQNVPISWDSGNAALTLVTADIGTAGSTPTWTVISDCLVLSTAYTGARTAATGEIALPVRRLIYSLSSGQLFIGPLNNRQPLISNVNAFTVSFGIANSAMGNTAIAYTTTPTNPALIRSVRLTLTLTDPTGRVANRTFNVVAAVRNRLR